MQTATVSPYLRLVPRTLTQALACYIMASRDDDKTRNALAVRLIQSGQVDAVELTYALFNAALYVPAPTPKAA